MSIDRARLAAVQAHAEVLNGRSVDDALADTAADLSVPQRARCRAITYEACRWHLRWHAALQLLLSKKLKPRDEVLASVVVCALVEIENMQTPSHAAVDSYVDLSKALDLGHARGLINAVLRRFLRERAQILTKIDKQPAAQFSHPPWLLTMLRNDWGAKRSPILDANNGRGPMTLRVNRTKGSRQEYLSQLVAADISAQEGVGEWDVVLGDPKPVDLLPNFDQGAVSVQDSAAQFAAFLLDPQPGQRVLDACAAPGGKTAHLLEWADGDLNLLALDASARRLPRVEENLQRLDLQAVQLCADAANVESWWDRSVFDRILLDAPCTGTGVIRRHPDIKLLRRKDDVAQLVATQIELLDSLWPLLAPKGRFLYATCSILREENDRQMEAFLGRTQNARLVDFSLPIGCQQSFGWQVLPGEGGADGFFYALLERA